MLSMSEKKRETWPVTSCVHTPFIKLGPIHGIIVNNGPVQAMILIKQ